MIYITHIHRFLFRDETSTTVDFVPAPNVPGYKYRVIINGKPYGWLEEGRRVSIAEARFFYEAYQEAKSKENA